MNDVNCLDHSLIGVSSFLLTSPVKGSRQKTFGLRLHALTAHFPKTEESLVVQEKNMQFS